MIARAPARVWAGGVALRGALTGQQAAGLRRRAARTKCEKSTGLGSAAVPRHRASAGALEAA